MDSPTFPDTFSSIFLIYICMDTLLNIYFNMKDSGHFDKCNFPFLYVRRARVLFVHFIYKYITL